MSVGYTRQSSGLIITGAVIQASHSNNEYDALVAAFNASSGHNHDGVTTGGGAPVGISTLTGTVTTAQLGITANAGAVIYSGTASLAISGTAAVSTILQSGGTASPTWTTATYPATTTLNQILYSGTANAISGIAAGNSGVLITSGTGQPSISSTLPSAVQANITSLGSVTSGTITGLVHTTSTINGTTTVSGTTNVTGTMTVTSITLNGTTAMSGTTTISGTATAPTQATTDNSTKLATTAYVTTAVANAVAAVNPAVAVMAATTGGLPNSPIYANGASGIGATLTTLTTNSTLVIDGYTPIATDRILIKNQGTAAWNGVYLVTTVASIGVAWLLARALDYDQPSDMNSTGAIPVINGTTNGTTSWVQSSTVNTVGTDAVTYTKFSLAPSTVVTNTGTSTTNDIPKFADTTGIVLTDGFTVGTAANNIAQFNASAVIVVANGGSGLTTLTNHGIMLGAGTAAVGFVGTAAANLFLQSAGNADPTYSGTLTSINHAGTYSLGGTATITNAVYAGTTNSVTGGGTVTAFNITGGTAALTSFTVACGSGPLQYGTNNAAITITAPAADGSCMILITNGTAAGSITFSGFTVGSSVGDSLSTTNTNKFTLSIWRINGVSGYRVAAHQ